MVKRKKNTSKTLKKNNGLAKIATFTTKSLSNAYTNYKSVITTSELSTLYTVPTATTGIIKSIRVSNVDAQNDCKISIYLVDSSSVSYNLQTDRAVQSLTTEE